MSGFPVDEIAAIALGSNQGQSKQILMSAIADLSQHPRITILQVSPWYRTQPIGPEQPDFLNGCLLLHFSGRTHRLLQILLDIEQRYGRTRTVRWGPRTLDLDLLLQGSKVIDTEFLTLPHPRLHERGFVLAPLADIYPDWVHPILKQSIAALLNQVDCHGVKYAD